MSNPKVVIVTGVSTGIGRATAEKFAKQGCHVFGTVRNISKTTPLQDVQLIEMDVQDIASIQRAIQFVVDRAQRIDVLVNNAGVAMLGAMEETSISEAAWMFETNVLGILRTSQAVLPHMRAQGSGRIVNVSSVLGFLPAPYMGLYSATKHAVEGLSETLDQEVRQFGVRVSLVEPGFTKSNLDTNAPQARNKIPAYGNERELVARAIAKNVGTAPGPSGVATTIVSAALGCWRMRHTPKGQASLLAKLRRFMPAGLVDGSLRKSFGLG
jgi:NADP-dependent 3-hydroxy acid dehydrogenase YdfG